MLLLASLIWISMSIDTFALGRVQAIGDKHGHTQAVVVIDPGHGGINEGTIENGFQEKSMTLITAMAMYEELTKYEGVSVYMTRTDDRDMDLKERAKFADSVGADFLFSIHYNASPNHNLFGSEVWVSVQSPFNTYGYQFGYLQLETMEEMGLFLRGIKTRRNDRQTDYYGIIRESTLLGIPSVIIEHCHVDEERDVGFCDSDEKLEAFGRADATAVAKYLGLKSEILGVDYSDIPLTLPDGGGEMPIAFTLKDETFPDVCLIALESVDYENGTVAIEVKGADFDSVLLYYCYSIDGGITYSPLQPWPQSNALNGSYAEFFTLTLDIPSGISPHILVKAYNLFDGFTESNEISSLGLFSYGLEPEEAADTTGMAGADNMQENLAHEIDEPNNTLMPSSDEQGQEWDIWSKILLTVCILCATFLLTVTLVMRYYFQRRKRKKKLS